MRRASQDQFFGASLIARRLVLVFACLCAGSLNHRALAAKTVTALDECPTSGPFSACLAIPFHLLDDTRKANKDQAGLPVVGRLPGRHRERLVLKISSATSREAPYGAVAYLGRSSRNRPIILTTDGPLELMSGVQRTTLPHNLFVVRTGYRWRVAGRYSEVASPVYAASNGTLWIKGNGGACVSAPQNKPGPLTANQSACSEENGLFARRRVIPAVNPNFGRVQRLLPELQNFRGGQVSDNVLGSPDNGYDYLEAFSLIGTPYLIVRIGCDCE